MVERRRESLAEEALLVFLLFCLEVDCCHRLRFETVVMLAAQQQCPRETTFVNIETLNTLNQQPCLDATNYVGYYHIDLLS